MLQGKASGVEAIHLAMGRLDFNSCSDHCWSNRVRAMFVCSRLDQTFAIELSL